MRVIVQRVVSASVSVEERHVSSIGKGFLLLVGIMTEDGPEDIAYLAKKLLSIKLFPAKEGNGEWKQSIQDISGEILSVSQFTLFAKTAKGTKPDFHRAANGLISKPLYEEFLELLGKSYQPDKIKDGAFGEMMKVQLVNDGPVTIILDSKEKTL
jgi:D-tyrosyl-tRNA(Tyr) deacylase